MDTFFNHEYAQEVTETISKMDDDTADMFSLMVVHDVLHRHIDDNRVTVSKRVNEVLLDISDQVFKAAERLGYDTDSEATLALTEMVTKSYVRPVSKSERKVASPEGAKWYGLPIGSRITGRANPTNYSVKVKHKEGGPSRVKMKYKGNQNDGFNPAANNFDLVRALGNADKRGSAFEQNWNKPGRAGTNEGTYNRIQTGSQLVRDIGTNTGNEKLAVAGAVGSFAGSFGPEAEKVIGPSMRKTAYRYRGTEKEVDPELKQAVRAEIASQMRDQGPVRAAITPAQRGKLTRQANDLYRQQTGENKQTLAQVRNKVFTDAAKNQPQTREPLSPEKRMDVSRMAAVQHLEKKLPSPKLSALQVASGKIPPSEGVIINRDGHVVAQAVGYQEDHFLPFNLKNLKNLNGGSYVRTRSSGGLTTEDVYTGLMSGARSVTVVSRSGTFTVDFADDFRGVRRYGDVARQMVDRYGKTLDAVQSEQIERSPLNSMERAQIRAEVEDEYSGMADTREGRTMIEQVIQDEIKEAKRSTEPTLSEMKAIDERVEKEINVPDFGSKWMGERSGTPLPKDPELRRNIVRNALIEDFRADKQERMHRLDGIGYATALEALQEQFPYFIANVSRTNPHKDNERRVPKSRETDQGYVRPNYLRPKAVKEGYYDPEIEGMSGSTGKYSAASTNYQNRRNSQRGTKETTESESKESSPASKPTSISGQNAEKNAQAIRAKAQLEVETKYAEAAKEILSQDLEAGSYVELRGLLGGEPVTTSEGQRALSRAMRDPKNQEVVRDALQKANKALEGQDSSAARTVKAKFSQMLQDIDTTKSRAESAIPREFDAAKGSPKTPATFKDIKPGQSLDRYENVMSQMGKMYGIVEQDDNRLRDYSEASLDMAKFYDRIGSGDNGEDDLLTLQRAINFDPKLQEEEEQAFKIANLDPSRAKARAEWHRKRAESIERTRRAQLEWNAAVETQKNTY